MMKNSKNNVMFSMQKTPGIHFLPIGFFYILLAQITLLENASWILYFLILVDELPQILSWFFQPECSGKHVPYHEIHTDQHVDNVEEDTVAQIFDFVDATLKVVADFRNGL